MALSQKVRRAAVPRNPGALRARSALGAICTTWRWAGEQFRVHTHPAATPRRRGSVEDFKDSKKGSILSRDLSPPLA